MGTAPKAGLASGGDVLGYSRSAPKFDVGQRNQQPILRDWQQSGSIQDQSLCSLAGSARPDKPSGCKARNLFWSRSHENPSAPKAQPICRIGSQKKGWISRPGGQVKTTTRQSCTCQEYRQKPRGFWRFFLVRMPANTLARVYCRCWPPGVSDKQGPKQFVAIRWPGRNRFSQAKAPNRPHFFLPGVT